MKLIATFKSGKTLTFDVLETEPKATFTEVAIATATGVDYAVSSCLWEPLTATADLSTLIKEANGEFSMKLVGIIPNQKVYQIVEFQRCYVLADRKTIFFRDVNWK